MEKHFYSEQVKQLERLAPTGIAATVVNAFILVFILRDEVHSLTLILWLSSVCLITLLRHPIVYRNIGLLSKPSDDKFLGMFFIFGAALSGIAWGAAGIFLFPENSIAHQTFLIFVLGGMVAGAVAVYSVLLRAFLAFSLPALTPLIIRFFLVGDDIHVAMGAMGGLFAVIMMVTAKRFNATTKSNFKLQFEKHDLVDYLEKEKTRAEQFNVKLQAEIAERSRVEEGLERHKEQLADLVEERTAELKAANVHLQKEIEERKKLEDELIRTEKLESLGILAGGIAHDFNNILTGILGNISLATLGMSRENSNYVILSEVEKASLKAKALTQQLLTFSKGGEPVKKTVFMKDLITDAANFALRGSNVKCSFDLQEDLYAVDVDEGQMNQVIHNLLINAIQSMRTGGVVLIQAENLANTTSEWRSLTRGKYIKLTLRDHGPGIPKEDLHKIFDPYFSTKKKGTGLGLATTYSIIQKHGGYITVESQPGSGTAFFIYLPASEKEVEVCAEDETKILAGEGKILIMDDDEIVREALSTILKRLGYQVESVPDGEEAIKMYREAMASDRSFGAVVMDLTIPGGMGGKEAVKELLGIDPAAKVIASSGYSNDPLMANFSEYGFRNVLAKPYAIKDIASVLSKVLNEEN